MMVAIAFLAGLLLGGLGLWLWARGEIARRDERLALVGRSDEQWAGAPAGADREHASSSRRARCSTLADSRLRPIKQTLERFEAQARALEERAAARGLGDPAAPADGHRRRRRRCAARPATS